MYYVAPPMGCYKVNFNAVMSLLQGGFGLGYVIRNHISEVMGAITNRKIRIMLQAQLKVRLFGRS